MVLDYNMHKFNVARIRRETKMKLADLPQYDTIILYGMGFNGKSLLNRILKYKSTVRIICWDRNSGEYQGYSIVPPPDDFRIMEGYGDYIIVITTTIQEYIEEMISYIPYEYNCITLYTMEEYKDGFITDNIRDDISVFSVSDYNEELRKNSEGFVSVDGYCPSCETDVKFDSHTFLLKLRGYGLCEISQVFCSNCGSISRERATIDALNTYFPDWRSKAVHELSPRPSRAKIMQSQFRQYQEGNYSYSYFFEDIPPGEYKGEARCENLEQLTYLDESFDFLITTDVFEHINNPLLAFTEIGRVLKRGGAHIFTIPYNGNAKTKFRVIEREGRTIYLDKPRYHSDALGKEDCLVTVDWGYDIGRYIWEAANMKLLEYTLQMDFAKDRFGFGAKVFICIKSI